MAFALLRPASCLACCIVSLERALVGLFAPGLRVPSRCLSWLSPWRHLMGLVCTTQHGLACNVRMASELGPSGQHGMPYGVTFGAAAVNAVRVDVGQLLASRTQSFPLQGGVRSGFVSDTWRADGRQTGRA